MDSDLVEAINALRSSFAGLELRPQFGRASPERVAGLAQALRIPKRYQSFLLECDPRDAETTTPSERIRLIPADELLDEQRLAREGDGSGLGPGGWRSTWIVVARSTLLGDPYFLDTAKPDPEGDCPVYTAMSGTDTWQPKLSASSFALFLRILAVGMEVARGFDVNDYDSDNEQVFRESLGPKIREYDPAALKAGHWT